METGCGSVCRMEKRFVHESRGCIWLVYMCTYDEPSLLGKKKVGGQGSSY